MALTLSERTYCRQIILCRVKRKVFMSLCCASGASFLCQSHPGMETLPFGCGASWALLYPNTCSDGEMHTGYYPAGAALGSWLITTVFRGRQRLRQTDRKWEREREKGKCRTSPCWDGLAAAVSGHCSLRSALSLSLPLITSASWKVVLWVLMGSV